MTDELPAWFWIPAAALLWPWLIATAVRYARNLNCTDRSPK